MEVERGMHHDAYKRVKEQSKGREEGFYDAVKDVDTGEAIEGYDLHAIFGTRSNTRQDTGKCKGRSETPRFRFRGLFLTAGG